MARYWVSWYEPTGDGGDYRPLRVPIPKQMLGWWCTGYTGDDGHAIVCAVVEADGYLGEDMASEKHLEELLDGYWEPNKWRFISPKEDGWMPPEDRFPRI
jgi:hypothetical protein